MRCRYLWSASTLLTVERSHVWFFCIERLCLYFTAANDFGNGTNNEIERCLVCAT